jgi:hypothetical protein
LLQIKHSHTTPYHPQCNAQAEVQNKVIQKYLAAFVDKTTLDWPLYIAPMAFAYNTALPRSIKSTPFFLTYGIDARLPSLIDPDLNCYYGQSDVAAWYATLQHCRQIAAQNNIQASNYMQSQFNKKASPYNYVIGQMVWSDIRNFLGRNKKLSPDWEGPFTISKVYENGVVEIIYKKNKTVKINVAPIKPYIEPVGLQTRNVILLQIPLTNFPPNNQNLFQQRLPRQAVRPPPLDPLTLPPAPPAPQPAVAGPQPLPDNMSVTRSLQRHNNIPLLPPLTAVHKQFPFMYNQSVASGPSLVSDIYGLPLVRPGCRVPTWIKHRHCYLKKLSPAARNTLLTGNPFFFFFFFFFLVCLS